MKKNVLIVTLACFLISLFSVSELSAQSKKASKETVEFLVEQMHCKNCQAKIEKNIAFEKGVTDIKVDLEKKIVAVTYKTDKTSPEELIKGFAKIGYTVEIVKDKPKEENKK